MKILLSNDDGHLAPGILALHEALRALGDVDVIAPEQNNSAKSNALTLHSPLYVHTAGNGFRYVNGTPADCVHIALTGLLGYRPDLVVSGIDDGANMGDDTIYSGTVGAAMEGYLFGVPAIAFSQVDKGWQHLDVAALKARELVQYFMQHHVQGQEALAAQREYSQSSCRRTQGRESVPPGPPPRRRESDHPAQSARRHHVLNRQRGPGQGSRRGHGLSRGPRKGMSRSRHSRWT